MSNKLFNILLTGLATTTLLAGCVKDIKDTQVRQDDFSNLTHVQVINATVSSTRNSIFVDGVPVNYATIAYAGQFPASPNTSFAVAPGLRSFEIRDTLRTSTQPRLTFAENMQVDKRYTIFTYDTVTSPRQITVPTGVNISSSSSAMIRFANLIYSKNAVPAVDIYSVKRKANVFTNVSTTQVTDFTPQQADVTDTFYVRTAGSTTNLMNKAGSTLSPVQATLNPTAGRLYTLVFRGRYQTDSTNAIIRTLSVYTNQ